ncbi:ABC-2 type transport system ATP-binding protein [Terrimicrobium sacchariphilum]|jgi:ABC-2 type transport system ATP-binding protein|uniref:ABC-2 type transport system ATP-binding protein n=1 Tax=Terrimicrobium sacchariphilum TaxID=690879 RepID=A0A146G7S0_TERSA|nr:ATP-binding cassette domain-containing protein [Terrimicrobium sacchariphilum]GAT32768.1 ABC-2 type transport system ATP-binding protein [Terrimicrobium sacchariphilum]
MIKVQNLTKRYGSVTAVNEIQFEVGKGEIVGFLGPNGAGKSTTMRMLSCYLPPTSGTAEIAGYDIFRDSLRAREHIGYMPENVPLPQDMRVDEYLRFRAALKGVPGRRIKERLADVCELCSLNDVSRKLIGALSKGYRQRVGLADAMIHEPELLILDEPTIGLDPNQIRQVRDLIRNLRRHHTILLSTHILSEVEMTCTRVIIINKGRIEVSDTPENLRSRLTQEGEILFEVNAPDPAAATAKIKTLPHVKSLNSHRTQDWTRYLIQADEDLREDLHNLAVRENWRVRELTRRVATLEQIFAEITHKEDI